MKLDTTKVYSLEGMTKKQVKSIFDCNCPNLFEWIPFTNSNIAQNDDLIHFNQERKKWEWLNSFNKKETIKIIDLIK